MANKTKFGFGNKADVGTAIAEQKIDAYDMIVAKDTDELGYVSPAGEEKWFHERLGEDIVVNGVSGLGLANGEKLSKDWTAAQALKALVQKAVKPTYTKPSVSIANNGGLNAGGVEAGTSITPKLRATFAKNDAGNLTKLEVLKSGTSVGSGTTSPYDYTGTPFVIGDENVSFTAKATYAEGPIKKDNLGQESPDGHIVAGSVTSGTFTVSGQRHLFYGTGVGNLPELTSDNVRQLSNKKLNPAQGLVFNINVAVGQQYIIFAYPATLRDVNQVMYVETNDPGMASSFTKTLVDVADARGGSNGLKSYKVYSYRMATPAAGTMTFKVTI